MIKILFGYCRSRVIRAFSDSRSQQASEQASMQGSDKKSIIDGRKVKVLLLFVLN